MINNVNNLKWKIGDVEVIQLVEMEENRLFNSFIPKAKPEIIKQIDWLKPHFADDQGNLKAFVQNLVKAKL